jgi:hypothetical protein
MRLLPLLLVVASACASRAAMAQNCPPSDPLCEKGRHEAPPPKRKLEEEKSVPPRGVITLAEVTITGRIQKPIASVDVSRIAPKLTLGELRQPFLDRIEAAIFKDPF